MRVLVTAGSTWSKVDDVRILTNRFTGKTGLYLAQGLKKKGHSVTLLANPHCLGRVEGLRVIPYSYFDEFKERVVKAAGSRRYGAIIHSAAVSDYSLKKPFKGKIPSGKSLNLRLTPTEKIIKIIRGLAPASLLIQFKLESTRRGLIDEAYQSLNANKSDFVVANALEDLKSGYKGFLVGRNKKVVSIRSKSMLLSVLNRAIGSQD